MAVPFASCMLLVAHLYALPPRALAAIAHVEGGAPGVVHHNRDGTDDFGVMQVNTRWLAPLARYTRTDTAAVQRRLTDDACYNIAAAGLILRTTLNEDRGDLLRAVGDYHSHTAALNLGYRTLVLQAATAMFVAPAVRASDSARPGRSRRQASASRGSAAAAVIPRLAAAMPTARPMGATARLSGATITPRALGARLASATGRARG